MSFQSNPQLQKVVNFSRGWLGEFNREADIKLDQATKLCSRDQNRDAPRATGQMASKTYQIKNGPGSYSCVSDMFYSVYVNYGTWRMAKRPFFTDNMERHKPRIIDAMNSAMSISIKRFFSG